MTGRVVDLFRTLEPGDLERRVQQAAGTTGLGTLEPTDVRHLAHVLTSYPLVVTPLSDLSRFADVVEAQVPHALGLLASADPDEDVMHRVLALPDHVRMLGDKCLFETGVARRRGPRGVDLEDLGRKSYSRASHVLGLLADDRRLRRYYDQNAIDRMSLEEEVDFLARCAAMFSLHVRLLVALVHGGSQANAPATSATALVGATTSPPMQGALVSAQQSSALQARRGTASAVIEPAIVEDTEASGAPRRVIDLHVSARTPEEVAEQRSRDLIAAEKTVLFSLLDTERLRTELKRVVIHQDGAIDALCDELCLYSVGTQDPRKPASYFLVGPTGVGKNYLVESMLKLFEQLWGIEVPYLELEGPEFTYPSDINELKGAARGFIRSDEEGILTQFHRRSHDKPFSVILVDEVEKAHPQLRRFFLPIMDRGTITDNRGKVLNFANTTIFFTSNIGYSDSARQSAPIGFGDEDATGRAVASFVEGRMRKTLSPEFINRVIVIHFDTLTRAAVEDIFDLEMSKIRRRFRDAQHVDLAVTAAARRELIDRGYSRTYGARNLARVLNRHANIDVAKLLRADDVGSPPEASPALALIREMREGRRPYDKGEVARAVVAATRLRVPYDRVVVDVEGGEIVQRRG